MLVARLPVVDVAVVAVYFAATIVLGAWFARRQRDTQRYFVGGRSVGVWLVLISVVATETSTVTFLSVPGLGFNPQGGNLTFLQLALGYIVGRCFVAWLLLPQYFHGQLLTAYQLLRQRFDARVQRTASGIFVVTRTIADGMRLFLTALLLNQFTGWDIAVAIVVMGAATILYTYLGGMEAVIWTDVIQFSVYMLGASIAAVFIALEIQNGWSGFVTTASQAGKFTLFDFSTDPTKVYTFWSGLVGGAFFTMASHGADQLMVQRFLCARSLGVARAALIGSGFVVFLQFLLFLLIGVGLYVIWQQGTLALPEGIKGDAVFGYFIVHRLPPGVVGLLIAAVLSAAMSTLSSSLNSSAGAVVNDFYRPAYPNRDEWHYLRVSRGFTVVFGCAQVGVALFAAVALQRSVIEMVLSVAGLTTGLILGLFTLGRLPQPVSSAAALVGLVCGLVVVVAVWLPSTGLFAHWEGLPMVLRQPIVAWPWLALVGTVTTVAAAGLANQRRSNGG
ncbi:MAG: sodium:solute symporter [Gemmataceae bacterium]|nr:sodium:solute symporter [Gemmata sp.]MDW8198215.1 sodium:solute symporter [Gemmataceae bacterium]